MSEKIAETSLLDLATKTTPNARRDAAEAKEAGGAGRENKFDNYLQSYMDSKNKRTQSSSSSRDNRFANDILSNPRKSGTNGSARSSGTAGSRFEAKSFDNGFDKNDRSFSERSKTQSRMTASERAALRKSLAKTVAEENFAQLPDDYLSLFYNSFINNPELPSLDMEGLAASIEIDPEMAQAADEAAKLIWGLLFPGASETGTEGGEGSLTGLPQGTVPSNVLNRLAEIAALLSESGKTTGQTAANSLGNIETVQVDNAEMAEAIETTNVSAEMNIEAVLAELDSLLDGLPRHVLEKALAKTAQQAGLADGNGGGIEEKLLRIAAELGLDISVEQAQDSSGGLWSKLEAGSPGGFPRNETAPLLNDDAVFQENIDPESTVETSNVGDATEPGTDSPAPINESALNDLTAQAGTNGDSASEIASAQTDGEANAAPAETIASVDPEAFNDMEETGSEKSIVIDEPAENAEANQNAEKPGQNLQAILREIAEENKSGRPINTSGASDGTQQQKVSDATARLLVEEGILSNDGMLTEKGQMILKALESGQAGGSKEMAPEFSEAILDKISNLEKRLQSTEGKEAKVAARANGTTNQAPAQAAGSEGTTASDPAKAVASGQGKATIVGNSTVPNASAANVGGSSGSLLQGGTGQEAANTAATKSEQTADPVLNAGGLANQASNAGVTRPAATSSSASPMLDQIANIERLTEALRMSNKNGVRNLTMQLSPPELGKLTVRVESKNGVVSALFRVEQAESVAQLQNGMQQLKDNLRAHGIELGDIEVRHHESFSADANGSGHGNSDARQTGRTDEKMRNGGARLEAMEAEPETTGPESSHNPNGALNLLA